MTEEKKPQNEEAPIEMDETQKVEIPEENLSKKELKSRKINKLEAKIEGLEKEKQELFDKLQRLSADYANYQKRVPKQISDSVNLQKESFIRSLLPGIDSFENALKHSSGTTDVANVLEGINIVHEQIISIFKSQNVEQINAEGEQFDPIKHQAMMLRNEEDKNDGLVLEQFQAGYMLNGRVIRPAMVIVNKISTEDQEPQTEDQNIADENNNKDEAEQ